MTVEQFHYPGPNVKHPDVFLEFKMSFLNYLPQKPQNVTQHKETGGEEGGLVSKPALPTLHGVKEEEYCHGATSRIHLTSIKSRLLTSTWAYLRKQLERLHLYDKLQLLCTAKTVCDNRKKHHNHAP